MSKHSIDYTITYVRTNWHLRVGCSWKAENARTIKCIPPKVACNRSPKFFLAVVRFVLQQLSYLLKAHIPTLDTINISNRNPENCSYPNILSKNITHGQLARIPKVDFPSSWPAALSTYPRPAVHIRSHRHMGLDLNPYVQGSNSRTA